MDAASRCQLQLLFELACRGSARPALTHALSTCLAADAPPAERRRSRRSSADPSLESPAAVQHTLPGVDYVSCGKARPAGSRACGGNPVNDFESLRCTLLCDVAEHPAMDQHPPCTSLQVPDTPEDDGPVAGAADTGGGSLLRHTLRKSAEKARGTAAAAAAGDAGNGAAVAAHAPDPPARAAPPASALVLPPPAVAPPPACGPGLAAAAQQQLQRAHPANFLADAKAALQEASAAGGAQPAAADLRGSSRVPPLPAAAASARGGQVAQLALRRSPHASALGAAAAQGCQQVPAAGAAPLATAQAGADRTPQAQLGLRPVSAGATAPGTGRTDGGASTVSGGQGEAAGGSADLRGWCRLPAAATVYGPFSCDAARP